MFLILIYFKKSTFPSLKIIVDSLIDVRNETSKHHFLKSDEVNTTLLSDANVPVRFRAQQRAKYSKLQLTTNCIAAIGCFRHYIKKIWPTTEETNFRRHQRSSLFKLQSTGFQCWPKTASQFLSVFFQLLQYWTQHPSFRLRFQCCSFKMFPSNGERTTMADG